MLSQVGIFPHHAPPAPAPFIPQVVRPLVNLVDTAHEEVNQVSARPLRTVERSFFPWQSSRHRLPLPLPMY